jgi:hypothetical protein
MIEFWFVAVIEYNQVVSELSMLHNFALRYRLHAIWV